MEWSLLFFFNSVLLGLGLAMDAFSVSLANGLNEPDMKSRKMCGVAGERDAIPVFVFSASSLVFLMPSISILPPMNSNRTKAIPKFSNKAAILGGSILIVIGFEIFIAGAL